MPQHNFKRTYSKSGSRERKYKGRSSSMKRERRQSRSRSFSNSFDRQRMARPSDYYRQGGQGKTREMSAERHRPREQQYAGNNVRRSPRRREGSDEHFKRRSPIDRSISPRREERKRRTFDEDRPEERKIFDFKVFVQKDFIERGILSESQLNKICHQCKCSNIFQDESLVIPDIPGKVLVFQSDNIESKQEALLQILKRLLDIQTDLLKSKVKSALPQSSSYLDFMILIPEGLVALVIGGKGRQIKNFMDESGADIVVNQPVIGMNQRSVSLRGAPKHIATACLKIYNTLEKYAYSVENIEKIAEPIPKDKIKSCCKFVVKEESVGFIIGKNGSFTKYLQDELKCFMSCYRDKGNRTLRYDESVARLNGSLQDIQEAIYEFCKRLEEYYDSLKKNFKNYPLAMLIPSNLVTKIIGAGGCMIKEISQKAGGANIRIHSSKDSDRELTEIVVTIEGTIQSKSDAASMIIEQIELFKNGGPILATGQALTCNLAGQIRNSIPFTKSEAYRKEYEQGGPAASRRLDPEQDHSRIERLSMPPATFEKKVDQNSFGINNSNNEKPKSMKNQPDDIELMEIENNSYLDYTNSGGTVKVDYNVNSNNTRHSEEQNHYQMISETNSKGEIELSFNLMIPLNHPLTQKLEYFQEIERKTGCKLALNNNQNNAIINIKGASNHQANAIKMIGDYVLKLERRDYFTNERVNSKNGKDYQNY